MLSYNRLFLVLLVIVFISVLVISTISNYYAGSYNQIATFCENLPPKQYVHPVFLGSGPPIQKYPQPAFSAKQTSASAKLRCDQIQQKVLLIVHSNVNNSEWRHFQREQISKDWLQYNDAKMYFIVGTENNVNISEEVEKYDDILQTDIVESYHNISYKASYWIELLANCSVGPSLVIKIDDDVQVDYVGLRFLILRYSRLDNFVACRVFPHGTVVRNPSSKWYLSKDEYTFNDLGTYCQGMAYMISGNLIPSMAKNLAQSQFLWMDDWYVTRSLIGNSSISYYSLDQHVISTNSEIELNKTLEKLDRKKYRTIFAHFRPSASFPMDRQKELWQRISSINNSCREKNKSLRS